mmetsp:Transcript_2169/g.5833  ORF Transcript_2169/g.5833 Transcript_2169/m.5833 type:complete len:219 (-) Transcript_2169:282-938(-)
MTPCDATARSISSFRRTQSSVSMPNAGWMKPSMGHDDSDDDVAVDDDGGVIIIVAAFVAFCCRCPSSSSSLLSSGASIICSAIQLSRRRRRRRHEDPLRRGLHPIVHPFPLVGWADAHLLHPLDGSGAPICHHLLHPPQAREHLPSQAQTSAHPSSLRPSPPRAGGCAPPARRACGASPSPPRGAPPARASPAPPSLGGGSPPPPCEGARGTPSYARE